MLGGVGTPAFHRASRRLYGAPSDPILGVELTTLDLARQLESSLAELDGVDLGEPPPECHLAASVAETMREAVETHFGDRAPEVVVVDRLSANALAGPRAIRLRRQACFSDVDVQQLIHHEAFVHVATSLNGLDQRDLPILAASHPGTTSTQEGLAVFAESSAAHSTRIASAAWPIAFWPSRWRPTARTSSRSTETSCDAAPKHSRRSRTPAVCSGARR
jgi:hypothetical protein